MASTDQIDLLGVAKTLLSRRARSSGAVSPQNPAYHLLREITRHRRILVRQQTATANRIHALADQLFPGFLNESKSGLTAFSDVSLELMKTHGIHCQRDHDSLIIPMKRSWTIFQRTFIALRGCLLLVETVVD